MSEKYITLTKRFVGKWKWNCLICSLDVDPARDAGNVYQCTKCRYMMHLDELKSWMASRNTKNCPLCGCEVEIKS